MNYDEMRKAANETLSNATTSREYILASAVIALLDENANYHHTIACQEAENAALRAALIAVGDHEVCNCPGTTCLVWLSAAKVLGDAS